MNKAAGVFFEHFGISPGGRASDVHLVAETFGMIPWENLTKFLLKAAGENRPRLAAEVMEGHAANGTGGTCYSLTEALGSVVSACGLSSRPLTGHMKHGRNIHCALLVQGKSGTFILDPGYTVPGAVELDSDGSGEIDVPGRRMLWKPVQAGWELHTEENGEHRHRYTLESRVLSRAEFLGYWKDSFDATGLSGLHINMPGRMGGRISAHNENLRIVNDKARTNTRLSKDYPALVHENFGISPEVALEAWRELQKQRRERGNVSS